MAAPPRKWVSDGAQTLPCIDERAVARLLWRRPRERLGGGSDSAVIDSLYQSRAVARNRWRADLRLDPFFSREAAFLLDTMAAPPRKWVSGGAPTLTCMDERTVVRLLWRRLYERLGWAPIRQS